jgi:hypothetical protein
MDEVVDSGGVRLRVTDLDEGAQALARSNRSRWTGSG